MIQEEETQQISSLNEVSSQKTSTLQSNLSSIQFKKQESKVSQIEEVDADYQLTKSIPYPLNSIELRKSDVRDPHKDST